MSDQAIRRFTIVNDLGLHARAATKLVQLASKFPCEVVVSHQGQSANAKSVMGVLLLYRYQFVARLDPPVLVIKSSTSIVVFHGI